MNQLRGILYVDVPFKQSLRYEQSGALDHEHIPDGLSDIWLNTAVNTMEAGSNLVLAWSPSATGAGKRKQCLLAAGRERLEVQRAIEWRQETLAPSD